MKKFGILVVIVICISLFFSINPLRTVPQKNIKNIAEIIPTEYQDQLMFLESIPFKSITNEYSINQTNKSIEYSENWLNKDNHFFIYIFISDITQVWGYDYDNPDLIIETITIKNSSGIYTRNEGSITTSNDKIITEDIHFTKGNIHYHIGQSYKIKGNKQVNPSTFIEFVDKQLQPYNHLSLVSKYRAYARCFFMKKI